MIRPCTDGDFETIASIVNEAAQAYRGVVAAHHLHDPYMPADELTREISAGVVFWGWEESGALLGVMGVQRVRDATLIRHAYVRRTCQGRGIGGELLEMLATSASRPLLVGTWADAVWAIRFYERHGFRLVSQPEKDRLLSTYWTISEDHKASSVVLEFAR